MGSSLNLGPFLGPFYKGSVLDWDLKGGPNLENSPCRLSVGTSRECRRTSEKQNLYNRSYEPYDPNPGP